MKATWLGRWLDPCVEVGDDVRTFERGVNGRRFLNLSGQATALTQGTLALRGRYCAVAATGTLWVMTNPDYARQRVMVVAPHADDAELAAFGLYSRCEDVSIVTLTQGEIEAEDFQRLGLDQAAGCAVEGALAQLGQPDDPAVGRRACRALRAVGLLLPAIAVDGQGADEGVRFPGVAGKRCAQRPSTQSTEPARRRRWAADLAKSGRLT